MRRAAGISAAILAAAGLAACTSPKYDPADAGYDDGYAVGYNTACKIRSTLIHGDFKNQAYAEAYARGQTDGIQGCNRDRRSGAE